MHGDARRAEDQLQDGHLLHDRIIQGRPKDQERISGSSQALISALPTYRLVQTTAILLQPATNPVHCN